MKILPQIILYALLSVLSVSSIFGQLTTNRDGKIDKSFGNNGLSVIGPSSSSYGDSTVLPDGSIVQVRTFLTNGRFSVSVSKQLANGDSDTSFGQYGYRIFMFPTNTFGISLAVQPDAKLLIVGSFESGSTFELRDFLVLRLTPNGELDPTFGTGGVFTKDFTPSGSTSISNDRASSIILQPDGKIVVAGMSDQYAAPGRTMAYSVLLRLNQNGGVDKSFGTDGASMLSVGSNQTSDSNLRPMVAKLMQGGKIFAGITVEKESPNLPGTYATHALVLRYLQNGTLDPAFSDDGVLDISIMYSPTYPSSFETFAELSQGKTLILSSDGLIRLNADGSFDPIFGDAGRALIGGGNCYLVDFAVTDDNKIVVNKNCSAVFSRPAREFSDRSTDIGQTALQTFVLAKAERPQSSLATARSF